MKPYIYLFVLSIFLFSCTKKVDWLEPKEVQPLFPENNSQVKMDFFKPNDVQSFTWIMRKGATYKVTFCNNNNFDTIKVFDVGDKDSLKITNSDLMNVFKGFNPNFRSSGRFFWRLEQTLNGETKSCWRFFNAIISVEEFVDARDGVKYKASQLVTPSGKLITIMGQNLKAQVYSDGTPLIMPRMLAPRSIDPILADLLGGYYSWGTVVRDTAKAIAVARAGYKETVQGICPTGWHVPSQAEYFEIRDALGTKPAGKIKSTDYWTAKTFITDSTGFNIVPGGLYWNETMTDVTYPNATFFWTSSPALAGYKYSWIPPLTSDIPTEASTFELWDNDDNEMASYHRGIEGGSNFHCHVRCIMN